MATLYSGLGLQRVGHNRVTFTIVKILNLCSIVSVLCSVFLAMRHVGS